MTETKSTPYRYIHNRGSFFSEYFLGQLMQNEFKGKLGESTRKNTYRKLRNIYQRVSERLSTNSSPADTWNSWSFRLFEELGWPPSLERAEEILTDKDEVITNMHWFKTEGKPLIIFKLLKFDADFDDFEKGRRNTPHKVLERVVASSNSKWGIIFNGNILRLVRSESYSLGDSYLEINLEGIFESDSEEEFYLFYALFRKESFIEIDEESLLTKISEQSKNYATKVNESLRDGVFQALENLLKGIVADHHNKHFNFKEDLHPLYEEGLVFLYRLLFILYGESRDLLPRGERVYRENYSVERLRDEVDDKILQFHPNRYYLWESLSALFRLIRMGINSPDLYVTAYNGRLFNDKRLKYLPNCKVNDEVMKRVLIFLSRTEGNKHHGTERIAYNELGVDQLGSVYEGLLEYEPKLAEEDLIVEYIEKEFRTVPKKDADKENIIEEIPKGSFYLSLWGGRRKGSGSYYTPSTLTKFLVKQAIDPLIEGKKSHELLSIKIVDPAMGSGAFLVAAAQYLSEKYTEKYVGEGNIDLNDINSDEVKKIINEHRRLIAEHCIYGVDINPMAVELAKVSLWLATLSEGKPLSFYDHRLRCGNSLIGASLNNLEMIPDAALPKEFQKENKEYHKILESYKKGQLTIEESIEYQQHLIAPLRHRIDFQKPEDTVEDVKKKEELLENDWREGSALSKLKRVCDLWCSVWFWPEDSKLKAPSSREFRELNKFIIYDKSDLSKDKIENYLKISSNVAKEHKFFHWEVEFPEIFLTEEGKIRENKGFSVTLGNPPWDMVKENLDEFFSNYDSNFRSYDRQEKVKVMDKLLTDKNISDVFTHYQNNFNSEINYFYNSYSYHGKGHMNTYKLFLEKNFDILSERGHCSIIVPSSLYTDVGSFELRKLLMDNANINGLLCFENKFRIFPIHGSFKFVLLYYKKEKSTNGTIPCKFRMWKIEELSDFKLLDIQIDIIKKFSPETYSIMEFNSQDEINILTKLYSQPTLGEKIKNNWNVIIKREFNRTDDSDLFTHNKSGYPVFEGKCINQYNYKFSPPTYYIDSIKGRERLGCQSETAACEDYRLVYRLIAANTNERTMITSIVPPKIFLVNSVPYFLKFDNKESLITNLEMLYLQGVLNSLVIDYIIRLKVSSVVNYFYLYQTPIPRMNKGNIFFDIITDLSLKLSCIDESFSKLWKSVKNKEWNKEDILDEDARQKAKNQIDALVAHMFNLTKEEFSIIIDSFIRGSFVDKYTKIKPDIFEEYDKISLKVKYPVLAYD